FVGAGTFNVTAGIVTIAGPVQAPKSRIFMGAGRIAFGALVDRVYPEWWDGTDAVRIQAAIDTGKNVILSGTYDLGTTTEQAHRYLTIFDKHHQKIIGTNQATLLCTTQDAPVDFLPGRIIHIEGSSFIEIDNIHFEDLGVTDTSYLVRRNGSAG